MLAAAVFELFARKLPPERGFLTVAGLEQVVQCLETIHFAADDLALRASVLGYAVASLLMYPFAAVELVLGRAIGAWDGRQHRLDRCAQSC